MPRSGAAARDRLERAALELYDERGYDQTTAADIAARAGVTARTFFRHFADKREVLFHLETALHAEMRTALAAVPGDVAPLDAVLRAFRSMGPVIAEGRERAAVRHRVIAASPPLQERQHAKAAATEALVAEALRERGVAGWRAQVLAGACAAALGYAVRTWAADLSTDYEDLVTRGFEALGDFASVREG